MLEHLLLGIGGAAGGVLEQQKRNEDIKLTKAQMELQKELLQKRLDLEKMVAELRAKVDTGIAGGKNETDIATTRMTTLSRYMSEAANRASVERVAEMDDSTRRFTASGGWRNNLEVEKERGTTSRANAATGAGATIGAARIGAETSRANTTDTINQRNYEFGYSAPIDAIIRSLTAEAAARKGSVADFGRPIPGMENPPSFGAFADDFGERFKMLPPPAPVGPIQAPVRAPAPVAAAPQAGPTNDRAALMSELAALNQKGMQRTPAETARWRALIATLQNGVAATR